MKSAWLSAVAIWEGLRFLLASRRRGSLLPSRKYLDWRMGTVYGIGNEAEAKGDWPQIKRFLLWRRQMRKRA